MMTSKWKNSVREQNVECTYLGVDPLCSFIGMLNTTIKVDRKGVLRSGFLPRIAISQPVVRLLNLQQNMYRNQSHHSTVL